MVTLLQSFVKMKINYLILVRRKLLEDFDYLTKVQKNAMRDKIILKRVNILKFLMKDFRSDNLGSYVGNSFRNSDCDSFYIKLDE